MVVLLGAPGAGKGTQAPMLARQIGVPILASGDLLRAAVGAGTSLGIQADRFMSRGQLVPDETMVGIFLERLQAGDARGGAILDGFPRTLGQAQALDRALAETGGRVDLAIYIDVPEGDLVARMASRRICAANGHVYNVASNPPRQIDACDLDGSPLILRKDDDEVTVRARMAEQIPPLREVLNHYRQSGVLRNVDGTRSIDDVTAGVLAQVGQEPAVN